MPGVALGAGPHDGLSQLRRSAGRRSGPNALAVCILAAVVLLVPFGLVSIGFGAIVGVAGGLQGPSADSVDGQPAVGRTGLAALVPTLAPAVIESDLPYAAQLLAQARSWLGARYVFGGCSASGIDCSCFVQTVFRSVGMRLPRTSQQQYNVTSAEVSAHQP